MHWNTKFESHGSGGEAGNAEGSGDIQQEHMLHAPCGEEAALRARARGV